MCDLKDKVKKCATCGFILYSVDFKFDICPVCEGVFVEFDVCEFIEEVEWVSRGCEVVMDG